MKEFKTYHPIVNFIYFVFVITFSCFYMHPLCLLISLFSGVTYSIMLDGKKALKFNLLYMLPLLVISALMNPAFNHEGATILAYFPNGNPLTLESVVYGLAAAVMIVSVICHFSCYSKIMTSDKFIYLFGKIIPSLSLILSMVLRFVPKFRAQLALVSAGQKCIGRDVSKGNIIQRAGNGIRILSIMITWSLENAVETADSMKSRGYGLPGRTAFSNFTFDKRDRKVFITMLALGIYVLMGGITGSIKYRYFPTLYGAEISVYGVSVFAAYFLLCMMPVIIECWEARKWRLLKQKI